MPAFPIFDTHLHVWDPANLRYPWLDAVPSLNKKFQLKDFDAATNGTQIEKMIFVQCECAFEQCEQEVAWVKRLAAEDNRLQGIVAWAPLELGREVKPVLDRYKANPLVRGIRRIIQFEPDPAFCLRPSFVDGVQLLAHYDFTFDICVAHYQLYNVVALVRACPEVKFVLDHMGKPDIKNRLIDDWKLQLSALSKMENVHCKLSGLLTEANHNDWKQQEIQAYIDFALACFTPDRMMFGGDWPVLTQAASYTEWIRTVDNTLSGLSDEALVKIYKTNAAQFYRLN